VNGTSRISGIFIFICVIFCLLFVSAYGVKVVLSTGLQLVNTVILLLLTIYTVNQFVFY